MTKLEALAKDCIENHTHRLVDKPTKQDIYLREESIFIQGYRQSEKRIAELEKQIVDLKDYILQVSKFLHNNNNTRPNKLAYKERDVLLIKELKLFEKWELSK